MGGQSHDLEELNAQVSELRAEVERLQGVLAALRHGPRSPQSQDLREANEHLVLAALKADSFAEATAGKLDAAIRAGQCDALTGTPNRTVMLDRISGAIGLARRHQTQCAVAFLDVDGFKQVNDRFGHDMGDAVVKLVADRLRVLVRRTDTVCRFGGDEFVVLLADLQHGPDVGLVAAKLLAGLAVPAVLAGRQLVLSASMGIAICPDDSDDAATLISYADAAMYRSKRRGPGGFEIHGSR